MLKVGAGVVLWLKEGVKAGSPASMHGRIEESGLLNPTTEFGWNKFFWEGRFAEPMFTRGLICKFYK